ncbi:MAG: ATP-binding cassette domain-containing protein, partial [Streptosporangiaceae bacterium]
MNAIQLAAAAAAKAPGQRIGIGLILLVLLVIGSLSFGAVRLNRRRLNGRQLAGRQHDGSIAPPRPAQPRTVPAPSPPRSAPASVQRPEGGWAVETHGLTKRFGTNVAVDEVELLVPRGSAFGYLGPNGAGKTTLIRTLLGLTRAASGTMS